MIIYNKYDQLGSVESRYEMSHPAAQLGAVESRYEMFHPAAQLGCAHCLAGDSADTSTKDVTAIGIGFALSLGVFAAIVAIAAKNPRIA